VFQEPADPERENLEQERDRLYQQIGKLQVENTFPIKHVAMSRSEQRRAIDRSHPHLSVVEQCAALGMSRSTLYYKPKPATEEDLRIMRLMDELHLEDPTRGTRRMSDELLDRGSRQVARKCAA
jgi:putative transposase